MTLRQILEAIRFSQPNDWHRKESCSEDGHASAATIPFEYEVGMADLTVGVLGVLCLAFPSEEMRRHSALFP
jgi:hypothetical protein